jgi:hypothetical protein
MCRSNKASPMRRWMGRAAALPFDRSQPFVVGAFPFVGFRDPSSPLAA